MRINVFRLMSVLECCYLLSACVSTTLTRTVDYQLDDEGASSRFVHLTQDECNSVNILCPSDDKWLVAGAWMPLAGSEQFDNIDKSQPGLIPGFADDSGFFQRRWDWDANIPEPQSLNAGSDNMADDADSLHDLDSFLENNFTSTHINFGASSNERESSVDTRIQLNHSLQPLSFLRVHFKSNYSGVNLQNQSRFANNKNQINDQIKSSLFMKFRLPHNARLNIFGKWSQIRVRSEYVRNRIGYGVNLSGRLYRYAPWTSITYSRNFRKTAREVFKPVSEKFSVWSNQKFRWWRYFARVEHDLLGNHNLASLKISFKSLNYHFHKQAVISANVITKTAWSDNFGISGDLGGRIHADSGNLLGSNWKIGVNFIHYQPLLSSLRVEKKLDTSFFSKYRISPDFELGLLYTHNVWEKNIVRFNLTGKLGINSPRRYGLSLKRESILKGGLLRDNHEDVLLGREQAWPILPY